MAAHHSYIPNTAPSFVLLAICHCSAHSFTVGATQLLRLQNWRGRFRRQWARRMLVSSCEPLQCGGNAVLPFQEQSMCACTVRTAQRSAWRDSATLFVCLNAGLSEKAIQKKAACRAYFSKLLYLVENENVLKPTEDLNTRVLRNVRTLSHLFE